MYCLLDYSCFSPPEDHHGPGTRITQGNTNYDVPSKCAMLSAPRENIPATLHAR